MFQTALNQGTTATDTALDVELRKVFKVFNGETAVRGVDLSIRQGEFFSILGPSGCGKTTTLRLIAGFETPSAGELMIRGQSMTNTPAYRRPVNTVFQSYALFGHMNVWDNIAFGLRIKKLGKAEIEERVREVLQLVKMESFANRFPGQMSGGQQQRVALARASGKSTGGSAAGRASGCSGFEVAEADAVGTVEFASRIGFDFCDGDSRPRRGDESV